MHFFDKVSGSIRLKFTYAIVGLLALFLLFFLWNIRHSETRLLETIYQQRKSYTSRETSKAAEEILKRRLALIRTTIRKNRSDLSEALFTVDRGKCREIITELAVFPCIKQIILYDLMVNRPLLIAHKLPNGKFIFHREEQDSRHPKLASLNIALATDDHKKLGYLQIFYDASGLTQEIRQLQQKNLEALNQELTLAKEALRKGFARQLLILVLIFSILYITLYILFARIIYQPIRHLEHNLKNFFNAINGHPDQITPPREISSKDEFGRMGRFINDGITASIEIHRELAHHSRELSKLATVLEQSVQAILITDPEGRIEYANPAFTRITGYSPVELKGKTPRILKSGEHPESFYRELWQTITAGRSWEGIFTNRRKDGSIYFERNIIFPVKDEATGQTTHFAAAKQDITKERELEQQLQQTQKMESIGLLAGGIAHDFNNLLTVINGYAELTLFKSKPDNPLHQNLEAILQAGRSAQLLTSRLLAFSRKQPYTPRVIDLNQTLNDLGKMVRRLIDEDIQIRTYLAADLPRIKADKSQIEQVLINLIVNARDALNAVTRGNHKKRITIRTNVALPGFEISGFLSDELQRNRQYVYFLVRDNGIGMPPTTLERIFEPFFTTKKKDHGTGLGLSMIYGIVKQNQGVIEVKSEPDQGTTFKIYWPTVEMPPDKKDESCWTPLAESHDSDEVILLVEDDEAVRKFSKKALVSLGYTVYTAKNGQAGIKLLDELLDNGLQPDLIITDIIMPAKNGWEFAVQARQLHSRQKILFISGYDNNLPSDLEISLEETEFIHKPFTLRELANIVRKVLDRR